MFAGKHSNIKGERQIVKYINIIQALIGHSYIKDLMIKAAQYRLIEKEQHLIKMFMNTSG